MQSALIPYSSLLGCMKNKQQLIKEASAAKKRATACVSNADKVATYSVLELLVLDIEEVLSKETEDNELIELKEELSKISGSINLSYVKRKQSLPIRILAKVDEFLRLIAVWLILAVSSVTLAIPCIFFSPIDFLLVHMGVISVYQQLAVLVKTFLARLILKCSGIHVVISGVKKESFGKECVLACFSHSSSMDAFLLTAAIPVMALIVVSNK